MIHVTTSREQHISKIASKLADLKTGRTWGNVKYPSLNNNKFRDALYDWNMVLQKTIIQLAVNMQSTEIRNEPDLDTYALMTNHSCHNIQKIMSPNSNVKDNIERIWEE